MHPSLSGTTDPAAPYQVVYVAAPPTPLPYQQLPAALDSLQAEAQHLLTVCGYEQTQVTVTVTKIGLVARYDVWCPDPAKLVGTLAYGTGPTPGQALADFAAKLAPAAFTYCGAQL